MSDAFIGEIRLFAGKDAPRDWAPCDGRLLSIADQDTLYALLGTTYGGDGVSTFGLPDLRGRLPVGIGAGAAGLTPRTLGDQVGAEQVTLTTAQAPAHTHAFLAGGVATSHSATDMVPATSEGFNLYADSATADAALGRGTVQSVGGHQPHTNVMPSLVLGFIICLSGIFPGSP